VKAEKINLSKKSDPAPRVISPRDKRYNVEVGKFLKPLEPLLYKAVADHFGEVTILKGLNAEERAFHLRKKWDKFHDCCVVSLDASRFDQHVSRSALEWEHSIYLRHYKGNKELQKLLSWQLVNHCFGYCRDGRLKYKVEGTRMSGDMNTALGNCLLMTAMVDSYVLSRGIGKYSIADDGDDCLVFLERSDLPGFLGGVDDYFRDMGFVMKIDCVARNFEQIEFCQTQPVFDGAIYRMVRNPRLSMAKDCLSIKPLDSKSIFMKWLGACGQGGMHLTGGLPIMQNFYNCMVKGSGGKILTGDLTLETGFYYLGLRMSQAFRKPTDISRYSFWLAFGIIPDLQIEIERWLDSQNLEYGKALPFEKSYPNIWV